MNRNGDFGISNRDMGEEWLMRREVAERQLSATIATFLAGQTDRTKEDAAIFLQTWQSYRDSLATMIRQLNEGGTNAPLAATVAWVEETNRLEKLLTKLADP